MKYYLNEFSKFILAEKFTLNENNYSEADIKKAIDDYKKANQEFKNIFPVIEEKIKSELAKAEEATATDKDIEELNELADNITSGNITNITDVKSKTNQYLTKLDARLKATPGYNEEKTPNIAKVINKLNSYANEASRGAKEDEETEDRIINLIKELTPLLNNIFAKDTSKNTLLQQIIDNLTALNNIDLDGFLKHIKSDAVEEIIKIKDAFLGITQRLTELNAKETITDEDITALNTAAADAAKTVTDNIERIKSILELDGDAKAAKQDADENHLIELLRDAQSDPDAFKKALTSILTIVFKDDQDLVEATLKLNRDGAIAEEILTLGISFDKNPFLAFISNNKSLITSGVITYTKYAILHNSYISDDNFTDEDLRGNGKFGSCDIIFSKSFYQVSNLDMEEYLNLRTQTIKLFTKESAFKNQIIAEKYQKKIKEFFSDLFYTDGKLFEKATGNATNAFNRILKSLIQIKNDIKRCFTSDSIKDTTIKAAKTITNDVISSWINQLGNNKDEIAKLILVIATIYLSTGSKAKEVKDTIEKYTEIKNNSIDANDLIKFTNMTKRADINENNIIDIIKSLAKLGKLTESK